MIETQGVGSEIRCLGKTWVPPIEVDTGLPVLQDIGNRLWLNGIASCSIPFTYRHGR